jgi:hypothetical protein
MIVFSSTGLQAERRAPSWCFEEYEQGQRTSVTDFEITPVRETRMARAIRRLARRTVLDLTQEAAVDLTGRNLSGPGRFYLVRAGISSSPEENMSELIARAINNTRYSLYWLPSDRSVALFTSQTVVGERENHNIALVLRVSMPIEKVYVGCFVTD